VKDINVPGVYVGNPAKMIKAVGVGKIGTSYRSDFIVIKDIENPEIDTVYVGANEVK
jgi:adenine deaminase